MIYYLVLINVITSFFYAFDKYLAIKRGNRISEFHLLLLSFLGGAFLGLITMYFVHHKTRKKKFIIINIMSIIIWCFVLRNIDIISFL